MEETDKAEYIIGVSSTDATDEELDRMTRQLLHELRDLDVESAELTKGKSAPEGSKGDPVNIGSIMISSLPTVLPAVVAPVQAWSSRGQGRTVKFKGKGIEFEGSPEELRKLLVSLEAERKTREDASKLEHHQVREKTAKSSKIFISYRRADSADVTGRIYDRLIGHFGKSAIFKDVDSIEISSSSPF